MIGIFCGMNFLGILTFSRSRRGALGSAFFGLIDSLCSCEHSEQCLKYGYLHQMGPFSSKWISCPYPVLGSLFFSIARILSDVFFQSAYRYIEFWRKLYQNSFSRLPILQVPGGLLNIKMGSYQWRDPMSHDRLIFNMGIPIPGKDSLYIETGPRLCQAMGYITESYFSINSLKSIETGPRLCQAKGYITVSYFSINSLKSIETRPRLCQAMGYITVSYFSINSLKSIQNLLPQTYLRFLVWTTKFWLTSRLF